MSKKQYPEEINEALKENWNLRAKLNREDKEGNAAEIEELDAIISELVYVRRVAKGNFPKVRYY